MKRYSNKASRSQKKTPRIIFYTVKIGNFPIRFSPFNFIGFVFLVAPARTRREFLENILKSSLLDSVSRFHSASSLILRNFKKSINLGSFERKKSILIIGRRFLTEI